MKKGFTLIELLTIVVIIGIIAMITIPTVNKLVDSSRKGAFQSELRNIINSYDLKIMEYPNPSSVMVTQDNIKDVLNISPENYEFLELTNNDEGVYIIANGRNIWKGYVVCGTKENMAFFDNVEQCNRFIAEPVYTDEQITALIQSGYVPVSTANELNNIRFSTSNTFGSGTQWEGIYNGGLTKNYIQVRSINLDVAPYNTGEGWEPIGSYEYSCNLSIPVIGAYEGTYDGGGYKISGLYINRPDTMYPVGLFSTSKGSFTNIIIDQSSVLGGVGVSEGPDERNIPTGTLVGMVVGDIININNVKIHGNTKTYSNNHGYAGIGGSLIGYARAINKLNITNTKTIGNVIGESGYMGGLVGRVMQFNEILIDNATYDGKVVGMSQKVGGIIGEARYEEDADPETWTNANKVTIRNTNINAEITGGEWMNMGGFIGEIRFINEILIENSNYNGNIINPFHNVGGLIGRASKSLSLVIKNSNANGNIIDNYGGRSGGIVGTIKEVESVLLDGVNYRGNIDTYREDVHGSYRVGGLIGSVDIFYDTEEITTIVDIKNCSVKGDLKGAATRIGGLVGALDRGDRRDVDSHLNIENSSYEGTIYANDILPANYYGINGFYLLVGGLVGSGANVNITNSYAISDISARYDNPACDEEIVSEHYVGGLVGRVLHNVNITNSYYVGDIEIKKIDVIQDLSTFNYVNAVVGDKDKATLTNVYFDSNVTSVEDTLAIPKTTTEMINGIPSFEIYNNWDNDIWDFEKMGSYPILKR
ncbi:MAG: prepilin-type N-terminal cleavage/methylation domain-containing protein [Bacilli bacterium]|nr:prepilin-type N-terminal cleavage/methylation domain-containing protein [Bacilli bacterium]